MRVSPKTEDAAKKAAEKRELLEEGPKNGVLLSVVEQLSRAKNEMLVAKIGVGDYELIDYLTSSDRAALRLRHLCALCGDDVLAKYEAGSISAADFLPAVGLPLRVHVGVEKARKGYPARNSVEDYSAAEVSGVVTPIRAAS